LKPLRFGFDPEKSEANLAKHGIHFMEAELLWNDPDLLMLMSTFVAEPRRLAAGLLDGKHWTAVFTERADVIRLISVRRSRSNEKEIYETRKARHDR
jgi:uncharacterized DUF497 family protein